MRHPCCFRRPTDCRKLQHPSISSVQLAPRDRRLLRLSALLYAAAFVAVCVGGAAFLACSAFYNLVRPYNLSPATQWVTTLFYAWACSFVPAILSMVLLRFVRCPNCGMHLLKRTSGPNEIGWKEIGSVEFALLRVSWRGEVRCSSCKHEYLLN